LAHVRNRPAEIGVRLPEVERELSEVNKELTSFDTTHDVTSPGRLADRILLRARQSGLLSELDMLKQEQLSQSVREEVLQAQHDLLKRQLENAAATLGTLDAMLRQRLANEVKRVKSLADTLAEDLPQGDEAARTLAGEVQLLTAQFENVVETVEKVKQAHNDVTTLLDDLSDEYESIREQLELGGGGRAMVQVFFDLNSRAINAPRDVNAIQLPALDETRLASLQIRDKLRQHSNVERQFTAHPSDAVPQLVAVRREVLEKLQTQYANLNRALALLDADKRRCVDKALEVRAYISEQLFGFKMKSCPPMDLKTLTHLPGSLWWVFGVDHWKELAQALLASAERTPVRSVGIVLVAGLLLLLKRRIGIALERTGAKTRRISTDRYAHTGEALLWTSLLALPIPLLMGLSGWALEQTTRPSDWLQGFAGGLEFAARATFAMGLLAVVCRPGGLGASHFRWNQEALTRFRKAIHWFLVVYIPAFLLTSSCAYGAASIHFDSLGRVCFILAHVWSAIIFWRLFRGSNGVLATFTREHPASLVTRWRHLWFPLLLTVPLLLAVFAILGYLITAVEFSLGFLKTLTLIAGGSVLYGLALRWFTIKQRKLALTDALQRRRSRQEAAASGEQQPPGEIVSVDLDDDEDRHLDSISEQTRALLRLLVSLAVGVAIITFWSRTFPLIDVIDSIPIPHTEGLTLLGLAEAVLIGIVTYVTVRNLPGLLELGVLRTQTVEAGTRHAISTLCQYAVIAIGLTLLLNSLNVDWANFGWIAAALSVGLGFGLQEVVANFVCGLIVLLERPIRVGDICNDADCWITLITIHSAGV
jgi:potassium efflux system protein